MQKNIQSYYTEPTKSKCKSDQMNCIEFVDYISKYFKKIDNDTLSVLDLTHPGDIEYSDLLYQLIISDRDFSFKNEKSLVQVNNKRKTQIRNIIKNKVKYILIFEMLREIDSEMESIYIKRKKGYKKKKKDEDTMRIKELLERREQIEKEFKLDSQPQDYID
ncbi:uncharacterized protein VNE69_02198 [Vairimorpha necatrix]|uniref:Uncharacterized protein n=1 Tax=Vairimorpha necatrix TaxID=6039 RepID=A0AAX4J9V3_9MICR